MLRRARIRPSGYAPSTKFLSDVVYCETAYDCAEDADALVIVTEWKQFRALDLERLRDIMDCLVVVDLRNIYRPEQIRQHGFVYTGVGLSLAAPALG